MKITTVVMLLMLVTTGGVAQESDSGRAPAAAAESSGTQPVEVVGASQDNGLPRRPPEPRTLARFWPVFVIFAAAWLGTTAQMLRLGGRAKTVGAALASERKG